MCRLQIFQTDKNEKKLVDSLRAFVTSDRDFRIRVVASNVKFCREGTYTLEFELRKNAQWCGLISHTIHVERDAPNEAAVEHILLGINAYCFKGPQLERELSQFLCDMLEDCLDEIDPQIKPNQPVETYNIPVSLSSHTAFVHSIPELLGQLAESIQVKNDDTIASILERLLPEASNNTLRWLLFNFARAELSDMVEKTMSTFLDRANMHDLRCALPQFAYYNNLEGTERMVRKIFNEPCDMDDIRCLVEAASIAAACGHNEVLELLIQQFSSHVYGPDWSNALDEIFWYAVKPAKVAVIKSMLKQLPQQPDVDRSRKENHDKSFIRLRETYENKGLSSGEEVYKKCGFCFKEVKIGQELYLSCNDTFHDECLVESMQKDIRCPTCWREILCYNEGRDQLSGSR